MGKQDRTSSINECMKAYRQWAGELAADILKFPPPEFQAGWDAALTHLIEKWNEPKEICPYCGEKTITEVNGCCINCLSHDINNIRSHNG